MHKWLSLLMFATLAPGLSGCTAALISGAAAGGYYAGKDQSSAGQSEKDSALTAAVEQELAKNLADAKRISVTTRQSVVTLEGDVTTEASRLRADEIAQNVDGVKSVINEVRVNPGS